MSARRLPSQIPLYLILAGTLLLAVPFHLRPENFIVDDGYFYPQIARSIIQHQGSTFNGIMLTNGYHPLWMLFCVTAAQITTSPAPLIQILGVTQDLFLAGGVVILCLIAREARMRGMALGCLLILFFNMVLGIWRLLEAPLALLLQIGALVLAVPCLPSFYRRLARWRRPLLGLLLGLAMLARLDLLFFVLTLLAYEFFAHDAGENSFSRFKGVFLISSIIGLVSLPYLLWNWSSFHHLLPISGAIKNSFPHMQRWGFPPFTYAVVVAIFLNGLLLLKAQRTPFDILCLLTALAAALHLAYTLSFGGLAPWYLTTGYLSAALCVAWVAESFLQWAPSLAWLNPLFVSLGFVLFLGMGILRTVSNFSYTHLRQKQVSLRSTYVEPKHALAFKLKAILPTGTRIIIFDAPGGVAFYSGMSVLPVDGLVADYNYNYELLREGAAGYAARHNIQYLIAPRVQDDQTYDRLFLKATRTLTGERIELQAPLTRASAGTIDLQDSDLLFAFREINPDLEVNYPEIGVWRLRKP